MVERINSSASNPSFIGNTHSAIRDKIRVEYHPESQTFKPMGAGSTQKMDRLEQVEDLIGNLLIPTDYSSSTFLQTISTKSTFKGSPMKGMTEDVHTFLSGNSSLYSKFISSISNAQKQI